MAKLPKSVKDAAIIKWFKKNLIHQGKVRDTYEIDERRLLMVATDRISIFDFVLPALVPQKGEVLTALTHFWLKRKNIVGYHHLSEGYPSYAALSITHPYHDAHFPYSRALVVGKQKVLPFEMIFRHHLGGSIYNNYQTTGLVAGSWVPPNIPKWHILNDPLFTPSTKSDKGHDVNISRLEFHNAAFKLWRGACVVASKAEKELKEAYKKAYRYASERGILILDTKFECAGTYRDEVVLVDEALTPDSSRFTTVEDWKAAMKEGRDPIFYDKEPVRQWGRGIETPLTDEKGHPVLGINNLNPENPDHVDFVHSLTIPQHIIEETTKRYKQIFKMLVGMKLEDYQEKHILQNH